MQGGATKEGILCNLSKCGVSRAEGRAFKAAKKRGIKKLFKDLRRPCSEEPLNEADETILEKVIKQYLMGLPNRHVSYKFVYNKYLPHFFKTEADAADCRKRMIPSFSQFKYFIQSRGWSSKIKASRMTAAAAGTSGRSQTSEDTSLAPRGPGEIYQIDSTKADVYLIVSETNRRFIGKPTVYLVVDCYTRMVVSVHVTLGAPCYDEACVALVNVLEDKVALCARYGITITPDQWPNMPLPSILVADRQEFIWGNSKLLGDKLRISVVNVPKYRGDFKGLVESHIGRAMRVTWTFPGADDPDATKDEKSTKTDAVLTLFEFTRLMLIDIIQANNRYNPDLCVPREAALADIRKTPSAVAAWALKNIAGTGKAGSLDYVRSQLLTIAPIAHTTTKGLRVSAVGATEIYYNCEGRFLPKQLFEPGNGVDLVTQIDLRTMNHVYVTHPYTKEIVVIPLSLKRSAEYADATWEEGADYQRRQGEIEARKEIPDAATNRELVDLADLTIDKATERGRNLPKTSLAAATANQEGMRELARQNELSGRKALPVPETYDDSYEG